MPAVHNSKAGKIVVHRGGQETQTQKWTGLRGLAIPTCARARVGEASVSIMTTTKTELYDVVAVNIDTNKVRLMAEKKTLPNAEAIVSMAVMRRGVDEEFYAEVPSGKYKEGDNYES